MVLSTLHTNDSVSAITRMLDMGLEDYLLVSSLVGILAQRLVRTICPECISWQDTPVGLKDRFAGISLPEKIPFGKGCESCNQTGYWGRQAIYELLTISESFRSQVMRDPDVNRLRRSALDHGMKPLRQAGVDLVLQGITTIEEVLRVTQDQELS